ncbi:MAG: sigma-54 dependent transcriptional regulator [Xanthomonadaceae bacterium]|nr:sigma-54 dependent transcriptional regulator [Xanthomonadaceae bacterium]
MPTVLVIDDNPAVASALEVLLSLYEIDCVSAASPQQGLARLDAGDIDLVIQDMNFSADTTSGEEGVMLFGAVREQQPDLPVILLTAWTHLESAVELVRAGAADYLAKPWDDHKLMATVSNLLELSQTQRDLQQRRSSERRQQRAIASQYDLCGMVYADTATERVVTMACQVARAPVPVLIRGANGSGKECIARIVQANSSVRDGPFVTVNCGALPSELIEAELFGADAGAYTGANKAREGKFEAADGGTLFLDEIGNLPLAGQMKLLRVLETGRFERLGSNRERQVQVRVISASNADIGAMIRTGQFREVLYYRLNLIELKLPPLHERPADIVPLAIHFLEAGKQLAPSALNALQRYPWPGNVRELKNVIQRACLLAGATTIEARDLGLPSAAVAAINADSEPDRVAIEAALGRAGGNVSQAAAELGLSRQALYRRMERLGLSRG